MLQTLLSYCIATWGGAAKSHILQLKLAQMAVLKVDRNLRRLYPTINVYLNYKVLSLREIVILHYLLKARSLIKCHPCPRQNQIVMLTIILSLLVVSSSGTCIGRMMIIDILVINIH